MHFCAELRWSTTITCWIDRVLKRAGMRLYVGEAFCIVHLGSKNADFQEQIFADISGRKFKTLYCSINVTTIVIKADHYGWFIFKDNFANSLTNSYSLSEIDLMVKWPLCNICTLFVLYIFCSPKILF